jgi:hypothetical protein
MNNIDQSKLAEMLRLARASLNEEFLKKQTEAYQQWYVSSNQTWKTTGTLLPPHSVKLVYPTEQEIVQRALEIYNTLTPAVTVSPTVQQDTVESIPGELFVEPVADEIETIAEAEDASIEAVPLVVEEPPIIVEPVEEESKFKSLLTKWGGRGSF